MKRLIIVLAALSVLTGCATPSSRDCGEPPNDPVSKRAFDLVGKADLVIEFETDANKFDLGIGSITNGLYRGELFGYDQIEHFFSLQKRKGLIVIVVSKNRWTDDQMQNRLMEMNQFFFKVGYSRVVIQQGYGNGRGILSDKMRPQP